MAIVPLLLSLILGSPGLLQTAPPSPSSEQTAAAGVGTPLDVVQPDDADDTGDTDAADTGAAPFSVDSIVLAALPLPFAPFTAAATDLVLKPATPMTAQPIPMRAPSGSKPVVSAPFTPILSLLKPPRLVTRSGGPPTMTAEQIVNNAESLLRVPYVWGGTGDAGLDCSAYVSRAWGIGRRTTESLPGVAFQINKDELLPGDILNLTIEQDPRGYGHVRLFAGWANSEHSRMWVYEETPPRAIHRVITYDPRYTPMRRVNYTPGDLAASHLLNMLFGRQDESVAAPAAVDDSVPIDQDDDQDDDSIDISQPVSSAPHGLLGSPVQGNVAPAIAFTRMAMLSTSPQRNHDWYFEPTPAQDTSDASPRQSEWWRVHTSWSRSPQPSQPTGQASPSPSSTPAPRPRTSTQPSWDQAGTWEHRTASPNSSPGAEPTRAPRPRASTTPLPSPSASTPPPVTRTRRTTSEAAPQASASPRPSADPTPQASDSTHTELRPPSSSASPHLAATAAKASHTQPQTPPTQARRRR